MQPFFETRRYDPKMPVRAGPGESFDFRAHWHEDVEFLFVLEGTQGVSVESAYRDLRAGDLAVIGSRRVHAYRRGPASGRIVLVFAETDYLQGQLESPEAFSSLPPFLHLPEAAPLFLRLAAEAAAAAPHREVAMKAALLEVLLLALRSVQAAEGDAAPAPSPGGSLAKIRQALSILEAEYAEDLTMESVAQRVSLSPSHFSRSFRRSTGVGFRQYLNRLRVHYAGHRLRDERGTVTDIALGCGFRSLRTFHRAFQEIEGRTPTSYRGSADGAGAG